MTKKDYELIAKVINGRTSNTKNLDKLGWSTTRIEVGLAILCDLVNFMAHELEQQNPKFDRNKFLQACGIESEV